MRTRCHISGLVAIVVLGVAGPASAQSPPSTTAPTPRQVMPPPSVPDAAGNTGPARPANAAPSGPQDAAPGARGNADALDSERDGLFVKADLAVGPVSALSGDLQAGWMFGPQFGVFGSIGTFVVEEGGADFKGVGVRLSSDAAFVEIQIAGLTGTGECDSEDPCVHRTTYAAIVGAGVELVHLRHFGLELRGQIITGGDSLVALVGFGSGFYF